MQGEKSNIEIKKKINETVILRGMTRNYSPGHMHRESLCFAWTLQPATCPPAATYQGFSFRALFCNKT